MKLAWQFCALLISLPVLSLKGVDSTNSITKETVAEAQKIIGLNFSDEKLNTLPE